MNGFGYHTPSIGKIKELDSIVDAKTMTNPFRRVTLIGCQPDETPVPHATLSECTVDTTNYKINGRGWNVTAKGASGYQVDFTPAVVPLVVPPLSTLCAWIYITDITKIPSIGINISNNADHSSLSSFPSTGQPIANGWNLFKWNTALATVEPTYTIYRVRITGGSTAASDFTIGHIWLEGSEKAQIMFIQDGATAAFYNSGGYADLNKRGIPVVIGTIPNRIGTAGYLTEAQLKTLHDAGNEINFHSWDLGVTNTMTADELQADTMKCLKWLERKGYRTFWRCAWTQNRAPQHATCQGLLLAYAFAAGGEGRLCSFPFALNPAYSTRYNICRFPVHGWAEAEFNAKFTKLQNTRSLMVCYTHNIGEGDVNNATPAEWARFLTKIDEGIAGGWLEGVTMKTLFNRHGTLRHRQGFGDEVIELMSDAGAYGTVKLP